MEDGTYAGHHPADSAEAIAHLEALRAKGAEYIVFPQTALWWLDYYDALRELLFGGAAETKGAAGGCLLADLAPAVAK